MDLWFSILFKTILKAAIPVGLAIAAYRLLCRRYGWPVRGQVIYYLVSIPLLIALLSSVGELLSAKGFGGN